MRKAARAANAAETSGGCFCSHASNSALLVISTSGLSDHQRPFAKLEHGRSSKIRQAARVRTQSHMPSC